MRTGMAQVMVAGGAGMWLLLAAAGAAQRAVDRPAALRVLHVQGNVHVLVGAGGNITVSVGGDGVLMVDAGEAAASRQVLAAVEELQRSFQARQVASVGTIESGAEVRSTIVDRRHAEAPVKPIRYIIATHVHADHTGGNAAISSAGQTFTGGNVAGQLADVGVGAAILAHERVLVRMSTPGPDAAPTRALPTDTYYTASMKLSHFFNGEGIEIIHQPGAHTDGDSIVHFRRSDVIAAGDIYGTETYPVVDLERGGSINGIIDSLNRLLAMTVPEFRTEGGTMVVPGHGRISDAADVAYYRDMVTIIRDRIQAMIDQGMTLEQVAAARPTADWDPRYGASTGPWTTGQFVEAVYRSLSAGPRAPGRSPGARQTRAR